MLRIEQINPFAHNAHKRGRHFLSNHIDSYIPNLKMRVNLATVHRVTNVLYTLMLKFTLRNKQSKYRKAVFFVYVKARFPQ